LTKDVFSMQIQILAEKMLLLENRKYIYMHYESRFSPTNVSCGAMCNAKLDYCIFLIMIFITFFVAGKMILK